MSGYVLDNYLLMRSDSKHSTKYIHELTIILISPDGSNDLPHFAMLIRLYDV
ncbi:MAG: hypothetical protein IKB46_00620 [Paludibacteraceae bacterium]|nr:hypothetical protein [Paludibacteraceae bacterium]